MQNGVVKMLQNNTLIDDGRAPLALLFIVFKLSVYKFHPHVLFNSSRLKH